MAPKDQPSLNQLEAACSRATTANTLPVFINALYEFAIELFCNHDLQKTLKAIKDKGNKETKLLVKLEKEALLELEKLYDKVAAYIEKHSITNPDVLHSLKLFKEPEYPIADHYIASDRFTWLSRALRLLLVNRDNTHSNFVQTFAKIDENGQIKDDTLSPKFHVYEQEHWRIDNVREIRDWYALDQIELFFESYDKTAFKKACYMRKKNGQSCEALFKRYVAFILWDPNYPNPEFLKNRTGLCMDSYKYYVQRVFDSMQQALGCSIGSGQSSQGPFSFVFSAATGEFRTSDDVQVKFSTDGNPAKLIGLVLKKKTNQLSRTQAYNDIFKSEYDRLKNLGEEESKIMADLVTQVNKQFKLAQKPKFLLTKKNDTKTTDRIIMISSQYTRS